MQKAKPMNTTGVSVTLSVLDSNGNYRDIGTVNTNADGYYSSNWTPDIDGTYTVYASFAGSTSYWPSHAIAAFAVDPTSQTPTPTAVPVQSMVDQYFLTAVIGLALVIIACFAVTILILRKRP